MEGDASSFLTSLALGDVLSGIGFEDAEGGLARMGLASKTNLLDRSAVYNEQYADDDLSEQEDDVEEENSPAPSQQQRLPTLSQTKLRGEDDDYDFDEDGDAQVETKSREAATAPQTEEEDNIDPALSRKPVDIAQMFPGFSQDRVLNFTDLLSARPRKRQKLSSNSAVKIALPPVNEIPEARSTKHLIKELSAFGRLPVKFSLDDMIGDVAPRSVQINDEQGLTVDEAYAMLLMDPAVHDQWELPDEELLAARGLLEFHDWEHDILMGQPLDPDEFQRRHMLIHRQHGDMLPYRNADIEQGDWTESIIYDSKTPFTDFTKLRINVNDPDLVVRRPGEDEAMALASENALGKRQRGSNMWGRDAKLDPYNLSNDRVYDSLRESRKRVIRQTFGNLDVLHGWPAVKLQLPYYRTSLTKHEARAWHRPAITFPLNVAVTFSKVRSAKKKKDQSLAWKATSLSSRQSKYDNPIKTTADLSLRDTSPYMLTEFSEEYPGILSNTGMGAILVNYYRKRDAKDEQIPKADMGEPFILDEKDESPFLKFGSVEPGQMVPTYYNNLFRAPLFRHNAAPTDFLCIRATSNGQVSYYLREIKNLFVVGQTYPIAEVPGPHSRKVTSMQKTRLQAISARLIDRAENHRVKINRLIRYFPDTSELQMRQRLKEFMEYARKGPDQGFWVLKSNARSYEDNMKDVKPEDVVLTESMQVGQRYLLDAGYGKAGDEDLQEEEDETKMDIEQQLAPWIISKNFQNAAQNKAMLRLHGDGDPTGRGEAFSFVRVSMKEIFLREGESMEERQAEIRNRPKSSHKYNVAEQQQIYKEEIQRIWKKQFDTLSNKVPPKFTEEDRDRWERRQKALAAAALTPASLMGTPGTPAGDMYGMPSPGTIDPDQPVKILRIKRLVAGQWQTEIVKDAAIIKAYVRHRVAIEEETTKAEELEPTDDAGMNERRRKKLEDYIANLKHNQERRMQRKNALAGVAPDPLASGLTSRKPRGTKQETTRRCGNCGQVGHMKTNKRCPRWAEFNDPNYKGPKGPPADLKGDNDSAAGSPAPVSTPAAQTPSAMSPGPLTF